MAKRKVGNDVTRSKAVRLKSGEIKTQVTRKPKGVTGKAADKALKFFGK